MYAIADWWHVFPGGANPVFDIELKATRRALTVAALAGRELTPGDRRSETSTRGNYATTSLP